MSFPRGISIVSTGGGSTVFWSPLRGAFHSISLRQRFFQPDKRDYEALAEKNGVSEMTHWALFSPPLSSGQPELREN